MKKTLSILLVTVATLSLAACGNASKETAPAPATTEASQKSATETSYPVTIKILSDFFMSISFKSYK